ASTIPRSAASSSVSSRDTSDPFEIACFSAACPGALCVWAIDAYLTMEAPMRQSVAADGRVSARFASLPPAFAVPAGYGDFVAGILAIAATISLARRASWAIAVVWVFNVWGAADLLFAGFQGPRLWIDPAALGAAFFIPTAIVPSLLVTHALI